MPANAKACNPVNGRFIPWSLYPAGHMPTAFALAKCLLELQAFYAQRVRQPITPRHLSLSV